MNNLINFKNGHRYNCSRLFGGLIIGCSISHAAVATDLPVVNLGATTFYDGASPPGGNGWSSQLYYQNHDANKITNNKGDEIGLPKSKVNIDSVLLQMIYQGEGGPMNTDWGLSAILPFVTKADIDDGLNNAAIDGQEGMGDLNAGVFLQFKPIMGENGPIFSQRLEADVIIPVGKYDKHKAVNPGANFWSFNPYWAATFWATPKTTISWRLHYLWNAKNNNPSPETYGADVDNMQAGQAVHLNFNIGYAFTPKFTAGINGYWLNQFTDTQIDGHDVSGRKERALAIGPGAVYAFSREDQLFANMYFESDVRNRAEGNRFILRWMHKL